MDTLSDLKNKLAANKTNLDKALDEREFINEIQLENEKKIQNKVGLLLEKEKLELAMHREVVLGSMNQLNEQQQQNNMYLKQLNIRLNDMSDLEAIYARKREIMDSNYQETKQALDTDLNALKRELKDLENKVEELKEESDKMSLKNKIKEKTHSIIALTYAVIAAIIFGSIIGFGIIDIFKGIYDAFSNFIFYRK